MKGKINPMEGDYSVLDNQPKEINKEVEKPKEQVFRPSHYTEWEMEPMTFIMLNNIPFAEGNIIKYVMRWRKKNGIQDLMKAKRIIDMIIEMETNKKDYTPPKGCL